MERKRIQKTVFTAAAVAALTGGTAALAVSYWNSSQFAPSGEKKDLQANQVVFSGNEHMTGDSSQESGKDSKLWEKEDTSANRDRPQSGSASGYLFENGNFLLPDGADSLNFSDNSSTPLVPNLNGGDGTVYDVVKDASDADLVIGGSGNGSNENNGTPDIAEDSNNGQLKGDSGTTTPSNPDTPSSDKVFAVKDPEPTKNTFGFGDGTDKKYTEDNVKNISIKDVVIADYAGSDYRLYKGQSVTGKELYYALTTYAVGSDNIMYIWGEDAYNEYVCVDSVSFDGGRTFVQGFPTVIPKDLDEGQMVIKVRYRLSARSDSWTDKDVSYAPSDSRIYVLSEKQAEGSTAIDSKKILNRDNYNQNLESGTEMNLYRWQGELLGYDYLDSLFPGWMENGKPADWFYPTTLGQHVLEPAERIPLTDGCRVKLQFYFMSKNREIGYGPEYSDLVYLQNLTGYKGYLGIWGETYVNRLDVPEYVQAIDAEESMVAGIVSVPSTVLYINYTNDNLRVQRKWEVSEDNTYYASDEAGILMDKQETRMLSVPENKTELVVPAGIQNVNLSWYNQLSRVELKAENELELPEIDYRLLSGAAVEIKENLLKDYLKANYSGFTAGTGNWMVAKEEPSRAYQVHNQLIVSREGRYGGRLTTGNSLQLPAEVKTIGADSFEDDYVETVILSKDGSLVTFEPEGMGESGVERVLCYTQTQYEEVSGQLDGTGVAVELVKTTADGFVYAESTQDGAESAMLLKAPSDIREFYGDEVKGEDGTPITITTIGDGAFENCQELTWVILPESVTEIGSSAFKSCTALEGLLIDTKDTIVIGNESLDDCTSLRFVGSNAMTGIMEAGYDPIVTDNYGQLYFFAPTNALGYTSNCLSFVEGSGVYGYRIEKLGEKGRALCGTRADGTSWLMIRSGSVMDETIEIPNSILEIFSYAMADTASESGAYTFKWDTNEEHNTMGWGYSYVDKMAFHNAQVGKNLVLHDWVYVWPDAFNGCDQLETVTFSAYVNVDTGAFANCSRLNRITFDGNRISLNTNSFMGCDSLNTVEVTTEYMPSLSLFDGNIGFQFNMDWDPETESRKIRLEVPEDMKMAYLKEWRYWMCGYVDVYSMQTNYLAMKTLIQRQLTAAGGEPTEAEINERVSEVLLESENRLRRMLGMEQIKEEPTDLYFYTTEEILWDTNVTLTGVPKNTVEVELDNAALDLPEYFWYLRNIATDAFFGSKGLRKVTIPDTLEGIAQNAFRGVEFGDGEKLTLIFRGFRPPELQGAYTDNPFSFGTDDTQLSIQVPEGAEQGYLDAWVYPILGYESRVQLQTMVGNQLAEEGQVPDEAHIAERMAEILTPAYNRLRALMGLDSVTKEEVLETLSSDVDSGDKGTDGGDGDGGKAEGPEWPELVPDLFTDKPSQEQEEQQQPSEETGTVNELPTEENTEEEIQE